MCLVTKCAAKHKLSLKIVATSKRHSNETFHLKTNTSLGYTLIKRELARGWGNATPPSTTQWLKELDKCMLAETEMFVNRGCPRKWDRKWSSWNNYRGHVCLSPLVEMEMRTTNDVISFDD